jgi:hypothetical protein
VLFPNEGTGRVLATLAIHAHSPLRLGEIREASGVPAWLARSGVRALIRLELIEMLQERGHVVYRVTEETPYRRAILAAAVIDIGFRDALWPIWERLRFAMVIGSFADGSPTVSSDIDVLVVGDTTRQEIESLLGAIAERHDRQIDAIVMDDDEYRDRFGGTDYVLQASARRGIVFSGHARLVEVQPHPG